MAKKMRQKKKAQMEIMGLAIVIVILSFAILLIVRFVILQPRTTPTTSFIQTEMGANFLNALLKTTTECHRASVSELIRDCANYRPDGSIICSTGPEVKSCAFLSNGVDGIVDKALIGTLNKWNVKYKLYHNKPADKVFDIDFTGVVNKCESANLPAIYTRLKHYEEKVPLGRGSSAIIALDICS